MLPSPFGPLPPAERRRATQQADLVAVITDPGVPPPGDGRAIAVDMICRPAIASFQKPRMSDDHPLMIVQTSGTTGTPKTFYWGHDRMRVQAPRLELCFGLTGQDRHLALVKLAFFWERKLCLVLFCLGATIVVNRAETLTDLVARIR